MLNQSFPGERSSTNQRNNESVSINFQHPYFTSLLKERTLSDEQHLEIAYILQAEVCSSRVKVIYTSDQAPQVSPVRQPSPWHIRSLLCVVVGGFCSSPIYSELYRSIFAFLARSAIMQSGASVCGRIRRARPSV